MKKGFTLVEVLAVITIIAIISLIAVPRVIRSVTESRISMTANNIEILKGVTVDYFSNNVRELPNNIGDIVIITVDEMVEKGLISPFNSPFHSGDCSGYVIVTKISETKYEPIMNINCFENINSPEEDELYLHYTFDDFQEPTINLAANSVNALNDRTGYQITKTFNYRFDEYNTSNAVRIQLVDIDASSTTPAATTIVSNSQNEGRTFTTSVKVKNIGNVDVGIANNLGTTIYVEPGEVKEVEMTGTGQGPGTSHYMFNIRVRNIGDEPDFILYELMSEEKTYSTKYAELERDGIINDYSGNNNNVQLTLPGTPRWVGDSVNGSGSYLFDGNSTYIHIDEEKINANTLSFWFKTTNNNEQALISGVFSSGSWGNLNMVDGQISVRHGDDLIGTVDSYNDGNWNHLVVTNDHSLSHPNRFKFYINGIEVSSDSNIGSSIVSEHFEIGRSLYNESYGYYYEGQLDDIRIYNRVLSSDEIRMLYEVSKGR